MIPRPSAPKAMVTSRSPSPPYPIVSVAFILGALLSVWLSSATREGVNGRVQEEFVRLADDRVQALQRSMSDDLEIIRAVGGLYRASREVEPGEFQEFVRDILERHPEVQTFQWAPRVLEAERAAFAASAQAAGHPDLQIIERGAEDRFVPAAARPEYFPTLYLEPLPGNEAVLGFDHASDPVRWNTMMRARDRGGPVVSPRTRLLISPEPAGGFIVFLPIYRNGVAHDTMEERRRQLTGFVAMVIRLHTMVERAFSMVKPAGIEVSLYDEPAERGWLASSAPPPHPRQRSWKDLGLRGRNLEWEATFEAGGRNWFVVCRPTPEFLAERRSSEPIIALAVGLLATLLLGLYLLAALRRTELTERIVRQRTSELSNEVARRRQMEEQLRLSADHLQSLVENLTDIITIVEADGKIRYESPSVTRLLGYAPDEVIGKGAFDFVHPDDRPRVVQLFTEGLAEPGAIRSAEFRFQHKDGSWRMLEAVGKNLLYHPTIRGIVVTSHDITRRKQLERLQEEEARLLEQTNTELAERERVMRSLLEDLQEAKHRIEQQAAELQATNVRLKELAALKDEFVAKVSHELRTPLTSIKEGLSLLLDGALGDTTSDQRDFLATMDGDIDRLTELINNMLDISKIEAGRMRLRRRRVSVRELVEGIIRSYQPLIGRRNVQVVDEDGAPQVFVDVNRMTQVLSNLFSNAIKSTADDGTITFRLGCREGLAAIAVQDNGAGISKEDVPKLFQKFSQVGSQPPGRLRGTGLGLVVCKELTELHKGRIELSSELGQGTTFSILLPPYTDAFVLAETCEELLSLPREEAETVGVVAIEASAWRAASNVAGGPSDDTGRLAEDVRHHVHRGDIVLPLEWPWVAVFAVASPEGFQAMVQRLRQSLSQAQRLRFGVAVVTGDNVEPSALLAQAKQALDQGLAAPGRAPDAIKGSVDASY